MRASPEQQATASTLRPPEHQPNAWGSVAVDYHAFAGNITRPFADDAAKLVPIHDGTRVIDVAAGTGNFAFAAARCGANVLATDFAPGMVDHLRADVGRRGMSDRIRVEVMDGQRLDVDDA